ncbi:CDP-alcohol phosphatidyltransferase [Arabiibacter massiliensis]|uniref:CDP-alcohol phosphatidyltransferase n=1 Tax=Arabiibacter massiliensis TaxID=1870985 RepID=UPI0009BC0D79|nr:CDP-alcohol phosphatidyltransferase [Arabiibacter massiliensis]
MGTKAAEALEISFDELPTYLHAKHSVYMEVDGATYYLTDVNDRYWRAQDTTKLNEKGHYVDASELVPTVSEFLALPFADGKSITEVFDAATFYASEKNAE